MNRYLAALFLVAAAIGVAGAEEPLPPPTDTPPDYVIGPGDELQVYVWRNPELSVRVPVRPDGKISTPLVEDMVAVGKSPSGLARDMESVLKEFVRDPKVNVIVEKAASAFSQVKVVGQVKLPQSISFREGLTVLDVVLACGGLTDFAAPNRAQILRKENGKTRELKVRIGNLLNGGDMAQDLTLQPGDVLVIPQSRF